MKAIDEVRGMLEQLVNSGPVSTKVRRNIYKSVSARLDALEAAVATPPPLMEYQPPRPFPDGAELYYIFWSHRLNEPYEAIAPPHAEELAAWEYLRDYLAAYFEPTATVDDLPYGNIEVYRTPAGPPFHKQPGRSFAKAVDPEAPKGLRRLSISKP